MEDEFDQIEEYLSGKLSPEERAKFESNLEKDTQFKEKVENRRRILRGIEMAYNQELKDLLVKEEAKMPHLKPENKNRIRSLYPLVGMAATVTLLIIAFFALRDRSLDNSGLYAQYYQPYPNVEVPVSRSESNDANPFILYERGNYGEALTQFSALRTSKPDDPALLFYSGICQMELKSGEDAISSFKELLGLDANKYTRPSKWYLALAYLKSEQSSEAISYLNELTQIDDVYAKKAAELLDQLDKK